jgi:hypothetical protein
MDQTHEQVANIGSVYSPIVQRILAMQHHAFDGSFADMMPTLGLCRVEMVFARIFYTSALAVAA